MSHHLANSLSRAPDFPAPLTGRVGRTVSIAVIALAMTWLLIITIANVLWNAPAFGFDYRYYTAVGANWLKDGSYYLPHQLAGTYDFTRNIDVVYPPNALYLFVPFAVLPALLWWLIPATIVVYVIASLRPTLPALAVMAVLLCWPKSQYAWIMGGTDIWTMAAVTAGLRWRWPAVLILLKPTFAPFALLGIRARSWWIALAVFAALALLQLPLWFDYIRATANLRGIGLDYTLISIPLLCVPLVAWLGRTRHRTLRIASPPLAAGTGDIGAH